MVKANIVDSSLDFHRAIAGLVETLGDGFQVADLITIAGLAMDDDDDEDGTIIQGFINDIPAMREEIKSWSLEDSYDTVRAIEAGIKAQSGGELGKVELWIVDILKTSVFGHKIVDHTIADLQYIVLMVKSLGSGVDLPPLSNE